MIDRVGKQLGNYRIKQVLGRGGFAEVYLGEHVYLKTLAAVKVLYTRLSIQDDMESFVKEAQTIARLTHPNIVRVLDFGLDGETPFLVMDYASNGTLRQRHPKGSLLTLDTIVPYVRQVADALQYAHDEKFIHRDVKPENMLIGRRNEILLSDFGIALAAQSSRNQSTQDVTGTVSYMSPEQIQGKPRPASDQYSLGITVYEWLSGSPPFKGSFTELCVQHMYAEVPPLSEQVPTLSKDVAQVVMTTLAKDYKQRFGNINAFANALEQASGMRQGTGPISRFSTPPPTPQPQVRPEIQVVSQPVSPMTNQPLPQSEPVRFMNTAPETKESNTGSAQKVTEPPKHQSSAQQPISPYIAQPPVKQTRLWGFGGRQVRFSIIGLIVYGILDFAWDKLFLQLPSNSALLNGLGNNEYLPSIISILFALIFIAPLFFAAIAGPWVGLVLVLGGLLVDIISGFSPLSSVSSFWYFYAGFFLAAFLTGLAYIKTGGIYRTQRAFRTVTLWSSIGLVLNTLATVIGNITPPNFISNLIAYTFGLFLFLILLRLYRNRR